ncbi:serine/threonine protein phosphatase 1 [Aliiruegeria haliotis]|uniref:Serine/threonine protein phosphatase 1 n=1 Tax=Aliiruegeria haliotis TaxID=1280846 RepID=A0A2T0RFE7_9RHOB|nr:serine/threonine protein phosphatase 1 [Aliiruegeria haliotis]
MSWIRRLLAKSTDAGIQPPEPDRRLYAVGDIHGRLDLLDGVLAAIEDDRGNRSADIVFLGDYVDRGPESHAVLRRLMHFQQQQGPANVHCLLGNHDRMLLDFMHMPSVATGRWLTIGGQETVESFGVGHVTAKSTNARLSEIADRIRIEAGDDLLDWLGKLPLWWQSGNVVTVHALTDPDLPMEQQEEGTLLWARPPRQPRARWDGAWVVHGHTVVPEPSAEAGYIALDTGAWRTNRLTAACIDRGEVRFISG